MKPKHIISAALCLLSLGTPSQAKEAKTLKETVGKNFLIGTAMNVSQIRGRKPAETKIITKQFNSIVAEDCMKSENLQPKQGKFKWADADKFVEFGEKNDMAIIGHCLVWHSQAPKWLFTGEKGDTVGRDTLVERMKQHISAVVGRYKGRIKGWDVVNEAFNDDGTYRQSPFYKIIGPEYLELAFRFAHAADPGAELYYNDYSMAKPKKREAVCRLVEDLRKKGCRIDAVGMQSHCGLDYPNLSEYEKTIVALKQCGVKVMITELDINVLPNPEGFGGAEISQDFKLKEELNPYKKGLTKDANAKFEQRYLDLFNIYRRHSKDITRVTLWGLTDKDTWLNNFPVKGRTNYPLLFDRNAKPKPIINKITDLFKIKIYQKSTIMEQARYIFPKDYMADPAAHVFNGKLYIYPSHDWESGIPENDNGDHFNMKDYHCLSLGDPETDLANDEGVILRVEDIPWAGRQLWDNDVVEKGGKYYLVFSMKDKNDIFRLGVAIADKPEGPFIPQADPIRGSYSIDPCVFKDDDGKIYTYFGGLWGGQLQRYRDNKALENACLPEGDEAALPSRVARMTDDVLQFDEEPRPVVITDENGQPLKANDPHRFFEASWMHKHEGKYYFSYSTGDSHLLCYAIGDNPYGPFVYKGVLLEPVVGWTTHHCITEYKGRTYLFHHDCVPSEGRTWLRSLKVKEIFYGDDGLFK